MKDSTIDKVARTVDGRIYFFYNENTGDKESINGFNLPELEEFYKNLVEYLECQENAKRISHEETIVELSHLMYDKLYEFTGNDTAATITMIREAAKDFDEKWDGLDWVTRDFLEETEKFCQEYINKL